MSQSIQQSGSGTMTSNSSTPTSLLHHTMITAPLKVVFNTFYFTTAGVLTGATLGVYRSVPAIPTAFKTGVNTGIFSFAFFSIREYALHPLISLTLPSLRPFPPSPIEIPTRTNNILSTSIAGTITGTLFSYFSKGGVIKGSFKAGLTLGLGCTVLQGVVNEFSLLRIRTLVWSEERKELLRELDAKEVLALSNQSNSKNEDGTSNSNSSEPIPTYTRDINNPTPNVPSRETFSERSDRLIGGSFNSFKRGLERISPVRKMEDEDYEKALDSRLSGIEKEREEIRIELEELRKL